MSRPRERQLRGGFSISDVHTVRHCTQTVKGVREIDNDSHLTVVDDASVEPASDSVVAPPSPVTGYAFKREDSARGGRVSQQRAREKRERARLTFEEILRRQWEEKASQYVDRMIAAGMETGDVPTFKAITDRLYGTPTQRQEIEDVTEREAITDEQIAELRALEAEQKRRRAA